MTEKIKQHADKFFSKKFILVLLCTMPIIYVMIIAVHTKQEVVVVTCATILGTMIQSYNHYNVKAKGSQNDVTHT